MLVAWNKIVPKMKIEIRNAIFFSPENSTVSIIME